MSKAENAAPKGEMAPGMKMSDGADVELFSRNVQSTVGLFTGVVVAGTALGGLFALVFAFAYGRIGRADPRVMAALLAGASFVALALVSALKYPANPPSIGQMETDGYRSELYFSMIFISVGAAVAAILIGRRLVVASGRWNGWLMSGAAFIAMVGAAEWLLPGINEVPPNFPADLLWQFRIDALSIQLIRWTTIGLVFGVFAERVMNDQRGFALSALR
jgi:Probable cobalt transporter subunit (CbtA)